MRLQVTGRPPVSTRHRSRQPTRPHAKRPSIVVGWQSGVLGPGAAPGLGHRGANFLELHTTWLNIVFLTLAAVLLARFVTLAVVQAGRVQPCRTRHCTARFYTHPTAA